jgi:alpha-L-fucosidase
LQISFPEKIKLASTIKKENPNLENILLNKNANDAIDEIVYQTHEGKNLFQNTGLTNDGDTQKLKNEKVNPITLNWISKNAEILSFAEKGLPPGHYSGFSALSKDKQTLYLFVDGKPNGPIAIKGLKNNISRIRIVGEGTMLSHKIFNKLYWSPIPGIVYIDIPKDRLDAKTTVIAILLDKPLELYRENVGAVESNL